MIDTYEELKEETVVGKPEDVNAASQVGSQTSSSHGSRGRKISKHSAEESNPSHDILRASMALGPGEYHRESAAAQAASMHGSNDLDQNMISQAAAALGANSG